MPKNVVVPAIKAAFPMLVGLVSLMGCSDKVSSHYPTRAEAEEDRLFERGWLPAWIPPSSHRIKTTNDLDVNTSEGGFSFDPTESAEFIQRLQPLDADKIPGADFTKLLKSGHEPFLHAGGGFVWLFWVNEKQGRCMYWMKPWAKDAEPSW